MYLYLPLLFLALFSPTLWAAPVNINTADADTIARSLSGVGLTRARAIVKYRQANGPFKSPDELTAIRGIGPKMIEKNRPDIRLKH